MKGLLLKDLALMKSQKMYALIIVVIAFFMIMNGQDVAFVIAYSNVIFVMMGVNTLNYDAFDNGFAFLFTLPVKRKTFVLEKYVFSLGSAAAGCSFSMLVLVVADFLGENKTLTGENIMYILIVAAGGMLMLSILLPVELKFGQEKSRMALVAVVIVLYACAYLLLIGGPIDPLIVTLKLSQLKPMVLTVGAIMIGLVMLSISYLISCRIVEKKEF